MSTHYTNIVLYGPTQAEVTEWCTEQKVAGYVSPTQEDVTVLYENTLAENAQHPTPLEMLLARGATLSATLMCPALVNVVSDDHMYMYVLYVDGQMKDSYMSYTDKPPANGNARILAAIFDAHEEQARIEAALRREIVISATERHLEIMDALALPPMMIDMGYAYLEEGETPHDVDDPDELIFVDFDVSRS